MGVSYSAEVFFGSVVAKNTPLGKKLERYIDKSGGTPADTEIAGVEISWVGSTWTGVGWVVVQAKGSNVSFSPPEDIEAPRALVEDPAWRLALGAFFERAKVKDAPPVGWHFATSAM